MPPAYNWYRLFIWMAIGLVIYFGYGRAHSRITQTPVSGDRVDYVDPLRPTSEPS